ncbi:hypothetical protein EDB80DRAFT_728725 [Ilyonectria destructans]|nr:hypothetical protein EDB80DRAFT_728725 [Ilyonectria destructans]
MAHRHVYGRLLVLPLPLFFFSLPRRQGILSPPLITHQLLVLRLHHAHLADACLQPNVPKCISIHGKRHVKSLHAPAALR